METDGPGEDLDLHLQGAEDLRSMAAEVPVPLGPRPEQPRVRGRLWRRFRRVGKAAAYLVAAGVLFSAGWFGRVVVDPPEAERIEGDAVSRTIMPEKGVTLDVRWGDLPKRLVDEGVLDFEKFKAAAQASGMSLTPEQVAILTDGSDDQVHVDSHNAYFLLDVLWALGLANENPVLTEGPLSQRGEVGSYASTGGWTLGKKAGPTYVASLELVELSPEQQTIAEDVARNSYRPCCGNMTGFPDCNHGMAALALAELMASQGATADEIFLALKQVSPYWFPTQYHHMAVFFEMSDKEWGDIPPRELMGEQYSSSRGFQQVSAQLQQRGALSGGAGAGKASGCAP